MIKRTYSFQTRAAGSVDAGGDGMTGEGIANAFHCVDSYDEINAPGCFAPVIEQFLADGFISGLDHNWKDPIGKPTSAMETGEGLKIAWQLSATTAGRDAGILLRDKVVTKLSIGFDYGRYEMLAKMDAVRAYWEGFGYHPTDLDLSRAAAACEYSGVRLNREMGALYEVSPVTVPANIGSTITSVRTGAGVEGDAGELLIREIEGVLRDAGLSRKDAKTLIAIGYKGMKNDEGDNLRDADLATNDAANINLLRARIACSAKFTFAGER